MEMEGAGGNIRGGKRNWKIKDRPKRKNRIVKEMALLFGGVAALFCA
jgi:hypothetical protein